MSLYGVANKLAPNPMVALLATATITATNDYPFTIGEGAVGQGGVAGGATVAQKAHYSVPAMNAGWPYICLQLVAVSSAPTIGGASIVLTRMST